MTWSVRGIDDEARERVLEEARRAGMSVGEYLNALILEGPSEPPRGRPAREERRREDRGRGEAGSEPLPDRRRDSSWSAPEPVSRRPGTADVDRRLEEIGARLRAISATPAAIDREPAPTSLQREPSPTGLQREPSPANVRREPAPAERYPADRLLSDRTVAPRTGASRQGPDPRRPETRSEDLRTRDYRSRDPETAPGLRTGAQEPPLAMPRPVAPNTHAARVAEILETLDGLDRQLKSMPPAAPVGTARPAAPSSTPAPARTGAAAPAAPRSLPPATDDLVQRAVAEINARRSALAEDRGADIPSARATDRARGWDVEPTRAPAPAPQPPAPAVAATRVDPVRAPDPLRLSDPVRPAELPGAAEIDRHFRALVERIDAVGARRDDVAELAREIRRLRDTMEVRLSDGPTAADLAELRQLSARIEELAQRQPGRDLVAPLADELVRLREAVLVASPEKALRGLEAGYGRLADRLEHLDRRVDVDGLADRLGGELRAIRAELGQLPAPARLDAIDEGLDAITARLDDLAARPLDRHDDRIREEIADLRESLAAYDPARLVTQLDQRLRAVDDRLGTIERLSRGPIAPERFGGLLAELRSIAAPDRTIAELRGIEARVEEVAERLVAFEDRRREAEAIEALGERIAAVAEKLDGLGPLGADPGLADLSLRIGDLARRVEAAPRDRFDTGRLDDIEAVLKRVEAHVEEARGGHLDLIEAFEDRLTRIVERMERSEPRGMSGDVSAIGREIAALRSELARSLAHRPEIDLGQRIDRLAEQIDRAGQRDPEARVLAEIERRLADLAAQLDQRDRLPALDTVEDALAGIHRTLSTRQDDTVDAVRSVTRDALREFLERTETHGSLDAIEALRSEIRALQDGSVRPDAASEETLRSVQEALSSVVQRLKVLETRQPVRADEEADASIAAVAARFGPEPRRAERFEDTRPLEVGSGKPAFPSRLRPEPLPDPAEAPTVAIDPVTLPVPPVAGPAPSRKADFIAAARRAAQAAQSARDTLPVEPARPVAEPDLEEIRRPSAGPIEAVGPLSRIGRALRGGRRPLMLAAAAVLLAVVALQFVPGQSTGRLDVAAEKNPARVTAPARLAATAPAEKPAPVAPARTVAAPPSAAMAMADTPAPVDPSGLLAAPSAAGTTTSFGDRPAAAPPGGFTTASPQTVAGLSLETADPIITGGLAPPAAATPAAAMAPAAAAATAAKPVPADTILPAAIGSAALRKAALDGDAKAQFEVGLRYAEGRAFPADPKAASDWYARAAEQGFAPAQYRLGSAWEKGHPGRRDAAEAKRWYQAAAAQGNVRAMHNLGVLFSNDRDMANAVPWFQKAADHGVRDSQFNLGIIHALGSGVKQDLAVSYKWFALAAAQGDKDAEKKRDDVAAHLDRNNLASAKMAVQTFKPKAVEREPNEEVTSWADPAAVSAATPAAGPTDRVGRIQALLQSKGAYQGPIDGALNAKTRQALRSWQRRVGLKATGEPDDAVLASLEGKAG